MPVFGYGDQPPLLNGSAMNIAESAFAFACDQESLIGVISAPERPASRGVLIIVGGPQYRVGSHRQFTLLARALATAGIPTMRFDYRGMGDSEGELRTFEQVESDIHSAIDAFFQRTPDLDEVVLWGLCDAASAILFYAYKDSRVCAVTLVNPWMRTEEGLARAQLKHYYVKRLVDPALWRKIRAGDFSLFASIRGLANATLRSFRTQVKSADGAALKTPEAPITADAPLPERMAEGFERFNGNILLILSGNDLTSREFEDTAQSSPKWRAALKADNVTCRQLPRADHTFSRREWRDQVAAWTEEWVRSW